MVNKMIIIIIIVAALVATKFIFFKKDEQGPPAMASASKPVTGVYAIIAKTSKLDNVVFATGSIIANESTDLHSETSGIITQLNFKEGSTVNKNDLLIKINDAELQAQLTKLNSDITLAKQKAQRTKQLLDKEGASVEEYEDAQNRVADRKSTRLNSSHRT